jgi:hypothetical protein
MRRGFLGYVKEAFSARPFGMWLPPNWAFLAAIAVLGLLNPGIWLIGLGLEIAYLQLLGMNARFRGWVDARDLAATREATGSRLDRALAALAPDRRERFDRLNRLCRTILDNETADATADRSLHARGLDHLLWIHLRLLKTQQSLDDLIARFHGPDADVDDQLRAVESKLADAALGEDLRRSLTSQRDILQKRLRTLAEARDKFAFTESELQRIEQQAALIRDQSHLQAAPEVISERIDEAATELSTTSDWIQSQQRFLGSIDDLVDERPAILTTTSPIQTQ